jgi:hypothetical protein
MRLLFTKNKLIASKAIQSITGEKCSHVVLHFPEMGFVVHSNAKGVHIEWFSTFKKHNDIVYTLEPIENTEMYEDKNRITALMSRYEFSGYDYGAFFFLGFQCIFRQMFKLLGKEYKLPAKNLWQRNGLFLCTEWVAKYIDEPDTGMNTAEGLYRKLLKSRKWLFIP